MQSIVLGGGCFWCTESVFLKLKGVQTVTSGYMGGTADTADYETVCTGETGHIEVIKVEFDPTIISLDELLDVFFVIHDPTTLNRQGNDIGTQYASAIFVNDEQKIIAENKLSELKNKGINAVTKILPLQEFYTAEDYHQNFFNKNPTQPYCNFAIPPKLAKLKEKFSHLIKA